LAFVIETKTRTYAAEQLTFTAARTRWVASRRRRWCPRGAVPVLCVMRPGGIQRSENGVLEVSIDRLTAALRGRAGTSKRPAFLASDGRQAVEDRSGARSERYSALRGGDDSLRRLGHS
jgi:hypothetical protein